jgi:hypothetical protein
MNALSELSHLKYLATQVGSFGWLEHFSHRCTPYPTNLNQA